MQVNQLLTKSHLKLKENFISLSSIPCFNGFVPKLGYSYDGGLMKVMVKAERYKISDYINGFVFLVIQSA